MDREQLKDHLRLAAECGVSGISRDDRWRVREVQKARALPDQPPSVTEDAEASASPLVAAGAPGAAQPAPLARGTADVLQQIKDEIGPDCSRCKLHPTAPRRWAFPSPIFCPTTWTS